jgi:hypothetical protein
MRSSGETLARFTSGPSSSILQELHVAGFRDPRAGKLDHDALQIEVSDE